MKTALPNLLGAVIRDYFTDHLPRLRGTSPHTIHSYRDSGVIVCDPIDLKATDYRTQLDCRVLIFVNFGCLTLPAATFRTLFLNAIVFPVYRCSTNA